MVSHKHTQLVINTKWTVAGGHRASVFEEVTLPIRNSHTTPRHPSLAEIKTATTRNSSRLNASEIVRPVTMCQLAISTGPLTVTLNRAKNCNRQVNVHWTCIARPVYNRVVPYETTVEASMNKRLPAKGNFIDHAHKLLPNYRDVNRLWLPLFWKIDCW